MRWATVRTLARCCSTYRSVRPPGVSVAPRVPLSEFSRAARACAGRRRAPATLRDRRPEPSICDALVAAAASCRSLVSWSLVLTRAPRSLPGDARAFSLLILPSVDVFHELLCRFPFLHG